MSVMAKKGVLDLKKSLVAINSTNFEKARVTTRSLGRTFVLEEERSERLVTQVAAHLLIFYRVSSQID